MFMGVVETDVHAWTPNKGIDHENVREDSEQLDTAIDSFEDHSQSFNKKNFGSRFLRNKITQLINSCTNINSETNASQPIIDSPLFSVFIKVLEQTIEAFEDMSLYLFSTKLLEDLIKREIFMAIW
ncbi:hypothetical protein IEQ34_010646 [Dendrobium chrysotoxum]|uniref:Uncharacterized protein n=1 Tax=Dendrobium chrysotoxum TaxID=161865 RepID=A0AAV7GW84_DENCH|nr:hypothetical protein IEQ34_010646 [Dendrobium chrysotoxum]